MRRVTLLAAVLLVASTAQANVWERAVANEKLDRAADDRYESAMRQGDEHALLANSRNASVKEIKRQLDNAVQSYTTAATAKPKSAEPYFRIGKLLYSFYFDCNDQWTRQLAALTCDVTGRRFDRDKAREVVAAWDAFEARAPNDPRLSVPATGDTEILFERAILNTKLAGDPTRPASVTKKNLEAAARDYEKMLARDDNSVDGASARVLGNLAETYMMLGRMEESLDTYREALRNAGDTSTWYGYAVALDRDENPRQAIEIIRSLGREQREAFVTSVSPGGSTFFVPEGEKFYYFALVDEAFGFDEQAIDNWQKYIASGAHPEFQARAKAHLDALLKRKKRRAIPIEPPWPELFR